MEFSAQVNAMQHLKEQLEQRTRLIQANIQRQQEELRHIQEQLQRVQGQGIQVRMWTHPVVKVVAFENVKCVKF